MNKDQQDFYEKCSAFSKTDKVSRHGYHRTYPFFLSSLRGEKVKMLEVGVARKGSLLFWDSYFENLEYWGVDIGADYNFQTYSDNMFIMKGDQSDDAFLDELLVKSCGQFNFIIDDGSHVPEHQIATFNKLFLNGLSDGGIYIIEDIETSYWKRAVLYGYAINYGLGHPKSTMEAFKGVVDSVNFEFTNNILYTSRELIQHVVQQEIESITFSHNAIVLVKKNRSSFSDYYDRQYPGRGKV